MSGSALSGSGLSETFRLGSGGRVDREHPVPFTFNDTDYTGFAGDTLASALLAAGVHHVAHGIRSGRPRGIVTAGAEEPAALVQVEAPYDEPMLPATTVELCPGLRARGLAGKGRLSAAPDAARYDATHAHPDVLIVGAGPAGLMAALTAARSGARVLLLDEGSEPGGTLLAGPPLAPDDARLAGGSPPGGRPATSWVADVLGELAGHEDVTVLARTTAFGYYDDNYVLACERRTDHLGAEHPGAGAPAGLSRKRIWRIRARSVVLAAGAHERHIAFAGNDRPGVMLAASARAYLHRYAVLPGHQAVVFTAGDSAYAAALDLADAGVAIAAVADVRLEVPEALARKCAARGIEVLPGHVVADTRGEERVTGVSVAPLRDGRLGTARMLGCDTLLVSGGWNPAVHLFSQSGGALRYDDGLAAFVPGEASQRVRVVGAASGDGLGLGGVPLWVVPAASGPRYPWESGHPGGNRYTEHYVDLARDATVADIGRALGAGMRSIEHVKRYTTIGTGPDQGRLAGSLSSGVTAALLGAEYGEVGTTTFRPPYAPVSFAALAGRDRGDRYDPIRVTAMHDWHAAAGAAFENVGQWKRPWYYPRDGEDMAAAVRRECLAVRTGVAMMDVSTLGVIDVQGADAAEFLDRVYTNVMSTLPVGRIRYGLMCTADGMVLDDGTVARLASDRFLLTTTTGSAAAVLDWLEEWAQTEWPHLGVYLTSVTDHWATTALAGPRAREVLARVAPGLALDAGDFPFMTWRDATILGVERLAGAGTVAGAAGAAGVRARICRISFCGELCYEISVPWSDGARVWESIWAAGQDAGITPYGTEAMHMLRAEKGYPVIGQDTDGTVTPLDLGLSWAVSRKKSDFIGKRSLTRPDTVRADRKHLVGLLPRDPDHVLTEGSQLIDGSVLLPASGPPDEPALPPPPVPMLGHVTSSYRGPADYHDPDRERAFALALVKGGRDRIGETLFAVDGGLPVPVTVADPVFYDKEGARRDG